jgi:high-affinity K+ transport system ATPase subunit B
VPVDGRVVEGTALVNQAAVTGDLPGCQFHSVVTGKSFRHAAQALPGILS